MSVGRICVPLVVLALGLMGVVFPGIMPGQPIPTSEVAEAPMKEARASEPIYSQQEQSEDTTPQSQSNRLADYYSAMWDPIHRQPAILKASNQDCLKCHNEILSAQVLPESEAGLKANETLAWYQTLDTYEGKQETFHWRHLESPLAKKVMNLKCNFCHKGNDPREEAPFANGDPSGFSLRKLVDPEQTCLRCHGQMNWKVMTLPTPMQGPWHLVRDTHQNDCLSCHAIYRTVRHQVSYLHAENIEELANIQNLGGDVCYGCHGGRAWYNIGYPYPRHEYPGMDKIPEPHPDWAKDRPTESDPQYALPIKMLAAQAEPATAAPATTTVQESVQPQEPTKPGTQPQTGETQPTATTGVGQPAAGTNAADKPDAAIQTENQAPSTEAGGGQKPDAAGSESATPSGAKQDKAEKKEAGK